MLAANMLSYQHPRGTLRGLRPGASGGIILPVSAGASLQVRDVRASRVLLWEAGGFAAWQAREHV